LTWIDKYSYYSR